MFKLHFTPKVDAALSRLLSSGMSLVRVTKKAHVLRLVGDGVSISSAAKTAGVCRNTAATVCHRFVEGGLKFALYDKPRPGHMWLLSDAEEAKIVAMVCSSAPQGLSVWTTSVIAREAVKRKLVGTVSKPTIVRLLQRHALKPWREKNVVRAKSHARLPQMHGGCSADLREATECV